MHVAYFCLYSVTIYQFDFVSTRKTYDGYQILQAQVSSIDQLLQLRDWTKDYEFEIWTESKDNGGLAQILVGPANREAVKNMLYAHGFTYSTVMDDVGRNVSAQLARLDARRRDDGRMEYDYGDYNDFDAMSRQLHVLASECMKPIRCFIDVIGQTSEGRPIYQFMMTTNLHDPKRMAFWLDSLIHAREWIAGTTVMNVINHMLQTYMRDYKVRYLLDNYNFLFIPVMNPDGYVYSWDSDRFWRKSRNYNQGSDCRGTDLNRNYDWSWATDGTSTLPCSSIYAGPMPASEPETQVVQHRMQRMSDRLLAVVSIHTFAQMWLHPVGSTTNGECDISEDDDQQYQVAKAAAEATMAEYKTSWKYGNACRTIYPASGGTQDYAYGRVGIKYAFTVELRGPGFNPPTHHIEPAWKEFWAGCLAMVREIEKLENR